MATTKTRLAALETRAARLPPDGASLLRACNRLPESEQDAWWAARTEAELEAVIQTGAGVDYLDFDKLTETELEFIAFADVTASEYEQWLAELRRTRPGVFIKKQ